MKNSKTGIIAVSFGTTHIDAEERGIAPLERAIAEAYPDCAVYRAFTSSIVRKKLKAQGRETPDVAEVLQQMVEEGITHAIVQPLLLMKGHEYSRKIADPVAAMQERFTGIVLGKPLFDDTVLERITDFAAHLSASVGGEEILFMGHGSDHPSDAIYSRLQNNFAAAGVNVSVATVEGAITLDAVLSRLTERGIQKVHLFPLMLVAGDHAKNDMAGDDDDSWKNSLLAAGIEPVVHLQGLGEQAEIQQIFLSLLEMEMQKLRVLK